MRVLVTGGVRSGKSCHAESLLTGPVTYTMAIHRIMDRHPHRVVDGRREIGLEYNVYGEHLEHALVFKGHYSRQTAPIGRPSCPARRRAAGRKCQASAMAWRSC